MSRSPESRFGQVIAGRYKILSLLGTGAMAHVYEAEDAQTGQRVAFKLLMEDVKDRHAAQERFERAVLVAGMINHPGCIKMFDYGLSEEHLPYQVMEVIRGESLADLLDREEVLGVPRALGIFRQLLSALAACSDAGVIHRDVKPENILLDRQGGQGDRVKLIDFGIAKLHGDAALGHSKLTKVGLILGTPHYIAPEWVNREDADFRADLYSASILLYEMLTSAPPFVSEDRRELMKMHLRAEPLPLAHRRPSGHFTEALEALVRKGLAKEPEDRFQGAREFLEAVSRVDGVPVTNEELKGSSGQGTHLMPLVSQQAPGPVVPAAPGPQPMGGQPAMATQDPASFVGEASVDLAPAQFGQGMASGGTTAAPPSFLSTGKGKITIFAVIAVAAFAAVMVISSGDKDASEDEQATKPTESSDSTESATKPDESGDTKPTDESDGPVEEPAAPDAGVADEPELEAVAIKPDDIAFALVAFKEDGLSIEGFVDDLDDKRSNGSCRWGKVDSVNTILCLAEHDPSKAGKKSKRTAPGESKARSYRKAIERQGVHLRVEDVRKKKRKKTRRRIEKLFSDLPASA